MEIIWIKKLWVILLLLGLVNSQIVNQASLPDTTGRVQNLESFNRPHGTKALVVDLAPNSFLDQFGRTFGQYGSYRRHYPWQQAVAADRERHSLIHGNLRNTFPWLFKNLKTPSLVGYGMDNFWNSYAPAVPQAGLGSYSMSFNRNN